MAHTSIHLVSYLAYHSISSLRTANQIISCLSRAPSRHASAAARFCAGPTAFAIVAISVLPSKECMNGQLDFELLDIAEYDYDFSLLAQEQLAPIV